MGQYVALLDILGFKDIINNNSHKDVVDLFNHFRIFVQMSLAKHKTTEDARGRLTYDVKGSTINSNIISDSLIFWTNDNNASGLIELIECLHSFISFCHNHPHIYLRGGITYGDFYFENNGVIRGDKTEIIHPIMVGKALVDVYEIEKQLQIAGCSISSLAIEAAKNNNSDLFNEKWAELVGAKKLVEYDMPKKNGSEKLWTVNWVRDLDRDEAEELTQGFAAYNKGVDDISVKAKIENTLSYYHHIRSEIYKK